MDHELTIVDTFLSVVLLLAQAGGPAALSRASDSDGRRIAILIGNNAYSTKPLSKAVPEASEMQKSFDALGFETVLFANVGLSELQSAIRDVAKDLTAKDTVVVYFYGYVARVDNENLLLPIDFKSRTPVGAQSKMGAKSSSYPAHLLLESLKLARRCVLILDPGGNLPFQIEAERSVGLAEMKVKKNAFVLFSASPGKSIPAQVEKGLFGRLLREALLQPSVDLETLAGSVRVKMAEASGKEQVPWNAAGSRVAEETVLHTPGRRSAQPALVTNPDLTWDEVQDQLSWLETLLPTRRSMRDRNRREALAALDSEYGPKRKAAAEAAKKDEFETTAQYMARTPEARATYAQIEADYKRDRDRLEMVFKDPTGDPDPRALQSLKSQRFSGPCKAEWIGYDADTEVLTLYVGGTDRAFRMPVAEAKAFKERSSKLTCEGGFTPESVTVSDPTVKLTQVDVPQLKPLRIGGGVSAPGITFRVEPGYSEEARAAKLQGAVVLALIVDRNGLPRSIRVVKSLGMGLDEKAIEAVRKWRFKPGTKDGVPVPVHATIEVNFRQL